MKRFILNSTVAAIALLSTSSAFANDYNSGVVTKSPSDDTFTDVEFGSGWYLRGDITYNIRGNSESTATSIVTPGGDSFSVDADYDDSIGVRIGAGYYLRPNFRIEGNVETILNSSFEGTQGTTFAGSRDVLVSIQTLGPQPAFPGGPLQPPVIQSFPDTVSFDSNGNVTGTVNGVFTGNSIPPINGSEEIDAEYSATSFIVSGYYDLPTISNFTPYLGAGVGYGRLNYNETRTFTCNASSSDTCAFPAIGQAGQQATATFTRDEEFWAFAYQLSAGASYRIDDNISLDVGYSYTDFAGGDDISYDDGTAIDDDGFAIHQVRAGIRYDIW